ncbi:hypothetical protein [Tessaracoccus sp.]
MTKSSMISYLTYYPSGTGGAALFSYRCRVCGAQPGWSDPAARTRAAETHALQGCEDPKANPVTITNTGPAVTLDGRGLMEELLHQEETRKEQAAPSWARFLREVQSVHLEAVEGTVSEGRTSAKAAHLAAAIQKTTDPFSTGDVIRWQDTRVLMGGRARTYSVAALKAGGSWWLTGTGTLYSGNRFSYEELAKVLALETVTSVQVSETWAEI